MKAYIPDDHNYAAKALFSRRVTVTSYTALLGWFILWHMFLIPVPTGHPWVISLLHMLPLLAFIRVIITGNPRGHAWLCFVLLLPFIQSVLAATNPNTFIYGLGYSLLVGTLFTSSMMYARWQSRYNKQLAHWDNEKKANSKNPES
ncbi:MULTISPECIES: DUF2069 domain-containing protein [Neptuniibacter]|uniref:DUF2069 domain-containing protein n=1 Tax=Neptuniibacter TaxID=459520 RepID=UPI00082DB674|nr:MULTISPECIES: DUF2069 domain-containing protein [Neptuniibacter]MDO6513391.1 DUF2069 domain-containing protein [Neptuniibacter sp. 2_MG-2023]MDO6593920.1 DUF2069 domain-containing protein [Neptuniibacter sp. 1_MG-2023]